MLENNGTISESIIRAIINNKNGIISGGTIEQNAKVTGGEYKGDIKISGIVISEGERKTSSDNQEQETIENSNVNNGTDEESSQDMTVDLKTSEDMQRMVYIDNPTASITKDSIIEYGNGSIKVVLEIVDENKNKDGDVIKGVILSSVDNVIRACLTEEEKEFVSNGGNVEIQVSITKYEVSVDPLVEEHINEKVDSIKEQFKDLTLGGFFDIDIQKKVGEDQWKILSELNEEIEICIDIPQEIYAENRSYGLIREHEGICEFLEDHDNVSRTFTMRSHLFSTYAFVYSEMNVLTEDAIRENSTASCFGHIWIFLITFCGVILSIVLCKRKTFIYAVIAAEIIFAIVLTIFGRCFLEEIALGITIVVTILQWLLFVYRMNRQNGML